MHQSGKSAPPLGRGPLVRAVRSPSPVRTSETLSWEVASNFRSRQVEETRKNSALQSKVGMTRPIKARPVRTSETLSWKVEMMPLATRMSAPS